jgi:hypothetical protein
VNGLSVDLLDERFQPIPGFSGGRVTGPGGLDCPVRWSEPGRVAHGARPVRVQVRMNRLGEVGPRLYALYLATATS